MTGIKKPELLAPAGSPEALDAAISAGADAVYFGAKSFNARYGAVNFDDDAIAAAIRKCRLFGVKTNVTVNTQLYQREQKDALALCGKLIELGADALIVADPGLAKTVKTVYPDAVLHASTQACGQNVYSARALEKIGFSRMVAPRELSLENIKYLCENSPIETEIFVHGALCVSFSGQCLMSSVIGGRSGNRGECAQPCRLPYKCKNCYPLSLKDSCLASHITDILPLGVASLKIEGRMKGADYVFGVTSIYRKLIDEIRNATQDEIARLSDLFSRSGFTDGYFTSRIGTDMLGVRTEEQKRKSAENRDIKTEERKLPIEITGNFSRAPATVVAKMRRGDGEYVYSVSSPGEYPDMRELDESRIAEALSKCGGTVFKAEKINVISGAGGAMPVSAVNDMRRKVLSGLENEIVKPVSVRKTDDVPKLNEINESPKKTAFFRYADSLTGASLEYFDNVFLPVEEYEKISDKSGKIGVALPPVCFDGECDSLIEKLGKFAGLKCVLVTSLWQAEALSGKYELFGDLRLNVFNRYSASVFRDFGVKTLVCSCEAGIPGAAGLGNGISAVAYGRLPLMTTQKCAIKEILGITARDCRYCDTHKFVSLTDRMGASFVVCREAPHRNVIYNSVPVWMLDKLDEYERNFLGAHFIFTDESDADVDKIIDMAKKKSACKGKFKRI